MGMLPSICGDDTVAAILARQPRAARLLLDRGMHCVGCAIAPYETIAEACAIYGVSLEALLLDLARSNQPDKDQP